MHSEIIQIFVAVNNNKNQNNFSTLEIQFENQKKYEKLIIYLPIIL